ncbi:MAG: hypothetical protein ACOYM3_25535 [Terrimicrobiaceae bacterium]
MKPASLTLLLLISAICPLAAEPSVLTLNSDTPPRDNFQVVTGNAIKADSDVFKSGGRYCAVAFGNDSGAGGKDVTVNGVKFYLLEPPTSQGTNPAPKSVSFENDGITISETSADRSIPTSSKQAPFINLSSSYRTLLSYSSFRGDPDPGAGEMRVRYFNIKGLDNTHKYRIQIWCNDSRERQETKTGGRTFLGVGDGGKNEIKYSDGSTDRLYVYNNRDKAGMDGGLGSYFDGICEPGPGDFFGFKTEGIVNAINVQELP